MKIFFRFFTILTLAGICGPIPAQTGKTAERENTDRETATPKEIKTQNKSSDNHDADQAIEKGNSELEWKLYSSEEYDKVRFVKPTIVLIMRDLCPGCQAARDSLWESREVVDKLKKHDIVLFTGNAKETESLDEEIRKKFGATDLPVTIIRDTGMADEPVLLYCFPKPDLLADKIDETLTERTSNELKAAAD